MCRRQPHSLSRSASACPYDPVLKLGPIASPVPFCPSAQVEVFDVVCSMCEEAWLCGNASNSSLAPPMLNNPILYLTIVFLLCLLPVLQLEVFDVVCSVCEEAWAAGRLEEHNELCALLRQVRVRGGAGRQEDAGERERGGRRQVRGGVKG